MSRCDHVFYRMWCSGFDPWGEALWWCPRCTGIDTSVLPPHRGTSQGLRSVVGDGSATWSLKITERGQIEIWTSGTLSPAEAEQLARALRCAERVTKVRLAEMAGKSPSWHVEPRDDGMVVIWRWFGLERQDGMGLLPITPRKPATCDVCRKVIEPGAQAWRGTAPPRNGLYYFGGVSSYRFCSACVDAMERLPIGQTRGHGAGLRLVGGDEG